MPQEMDCERTPEERMGGDTYYRKGEGVGAHIAMRTEKGARVTERGGHEAK